jgi:hypothetical protein
VSTMTRRETTIRRFEQVVPAREPWGADWTEVMKAISAAVQEMKEKAILPGDMEPSADQLRMRVEDEAIVVYYEKVEVTW